MLGHDPNRSARPSDGFTSAPLPLSAYSAASGTFPPATLRGQTRTGLAYVRLQASSLKPRASTLEPRASKGRASPLRVEELSPGFVDSLVGVGSEEITLRLDQVGPMTLGAVTVIEGQRARVSRNRDA